MNPWTGAPLQVLSDLDAGLMLMQEAQQLLFKSTRQATQWLVHAGLGSAPHEISQVSMSHTLPVQNVLRQDPSQNSNSLESFSMIAPG